MSSAVFSPAAERDVLEIVEWISSDNPMAARGFLFALDTLAQTIGDHPEIGPEKPHIATPPIRFLPVPRYPYIAVYTPDRKPPLIIRILHGARDLPELFQDL
ncbi:MAG TPA: type II toxin-antitoxin system RelE/ParE family toxin [Rhodospirillaceae bacterium]|nr:hypothetical protein [Rhodospirillaceae bacterium]MBB58085.1 hypothetical protein [Rhodospirillaceae bacterium]HAJ19634.1 type II toxin-antitoxin system RelE/ParE family toxin [Rhodospirillaceae bacterium]